MPPGSGVPVPGRERRVEHVDVDGDVELLGLRQRLADGVAHHVLEAAVPDLLHRVPRHALLEHPLERVLRRPVAAQADLHEVRAGHGAGLDQPAHRRAVAGQVALDDVGRVGVGVEVDDADVAVAVDVGDRGGAGPRDRVVAAEDDRHDAARGDGVDALADVGVRALGLAVRAVGVAEVDDLQPVEDLEAEVQVVRARLVRRGPDRPRPEAGAGAVRRRDVERGADDRHVGLPGVELLDARSGTAAARTTPSRRAARPSCSTIPGGSSRRGRCSCSCPIAGRQYRPTHPSIWCRRSTACGAGPQPYSDECYGKRQRVARVLKSSSRSMMPNARSGTHLEERVRRAGSRRSRPRRRTWRGSARSRRRSSASSVRRRRPALDRHALDGVVGHHADLRVGGDVGRLARARARTTRRTPGTASSHTPHTGSACGRPLAEAVTTHRLRERSSRSAAHDHGSASHWSVSTP